MIVFRRSTEFDMGANTLSKDRPVVIVVGCDDLGSAIARTLHGAGAAVVLVDHADPPWARRGMSYTDAWYVGGATLERVDACFCGSVRSIPAVLARGDMIAATTWSPEGVALALKPVALIETRPGCGNERRPAAPGREPPRLGGQRSGDSRERGSTPMTVARSRPPVLEGVLSIGVRTTQVAGWRADVVIAGAQGDLRPPPHRFGTTHGNHPLAARELRIEAPHAGRFRTRHEIGERVDPGDVVGELASFAVIAPVPGVLVALSARGARITAGQTVAEIDPSADSHRCFGIRPEIRAIAQRVGAAVRCTTNATRPPHRVAAPAGSELPA